LAPSKELSSLTESFLVPQTLDMAFIRGHQVNNLGFSKPRIPDLAVLLHRAAEVALSFTLGILPGDL
jgi:hypothetical protein